MPLYEYECQQCHRHTEKRQKFSDPEITECPHCGGKLQRVLTAPAIAFKGGGWYADGYGNAKPKSSGDAPGKGEGSSGNSGGSENAPAATSDASSKPSASSDASSKPAPAAAPAAAPSSTTSKS